MRFLFLAGRDIKHSRAGGGDISAWEFARYLAARGHEVCYICSNGPSLVKEEEAAGVRILRPGTGLTLLFRTIAFYLRHWQEFDLVYEDVIGSSRPPYFSPLYVRQPVIAAWHQVTKPLLDDMFPRPVTFILGLAERLLAQLYRGTHIRVPSQERKHELHQELKLPLHQLHVIPASLPENWFTTELSDAPKAPFILYLGNIRKYKGIHLLIQALPLIMLECSDAKITIAGRRWDAAYEESLIALTSAMGLASHVIFKFDVSEDEKRALLQQAKILVLPSRLEGFGIVVLEANAFGVPVVVSSGVPEDAVLDRWNGLRVPYGDVQALASALIELLKDDALYRQLSSNCRTFARRFGLDRVGSQFEALVTHLVGRKVQ